MRARINPRIQNGDRRVLKALEGLQAGEDGWILVLYTDLAERAGCTVSSLMVCLDSLVRNDAIERRKFRVQGRPRVAVRLIRVEVTTK